ncbi:hypothetical protein [Streptomyces sp. NPDC059816]|uniref:hypothetical protein n=1 Tax=Streptomyces sp. NPDC059816 TaxID=3346960 RepID=UPI003666BAF9
MPSTTPTPATDTDRLRTAARFVRNQDTTALLSSLLPGLDAGRTRMLANRCRFSHAALLIFPPDPRTLHAQLAACGLPVDERVIPVPSVVVRDRLAARHRRAARELDVRILRPSAPGPHGTHRTVEVFVLLVPPGSDLTEVADHERAGDHEAHLAFDIDDPDPSVLRGVHTTLVQHGAIPEGGGYNPHEDGTVFYFVAPGHAHGGYRRLELYAHGDHRDLLTAAP